MRQILTISMIACCLCLQGQGLSDSYPKMVDRIIQSLGPGSDETVIVRYDAGHLSDLAATLSDRLSGMVRRVDLLPYGPVSNFEELLAETDIYMWMPVRRSVPPQGAQVAALVKWLDEGRGRQIHFHWGDGTRNWDSTQGVHNAVYDSVYLKALDIDYKELGRQQLTAEEILRSGTIKVTSPKGTDLSFSIGKRTVTRQDGDASARRMKTARVRIEREIELPAGAIRVAPIESSVEGTLFIGTGSIGGIEVENLSLTFKQGKVVEVSADKGKAAFENLMQRSTGYKYFRELGIGFNPALNFPNGYDYVPYYGYGQGVVRLSLGNNIEVGGAVDQDGVQWMFFLDCTVTVGNRTIVSNGVLQDL